MTQFFFLINLPVCEKNAEKGAAVANRHWLKKTPENSFLLIAIMITIVAVSTPHYQACWHEQMNPDLSRHWLLPPPPDRSGDVVTVATAIKLPSIDPIDEQSTEEEMEHFYLESTEAMRAFIALHPVPELRNDLLEDIDSGRVKIVITPDDSVEIRFDAVRGEPTARLLVNGYLPKAMIDNDVLNVQIQAELYYRFLIFENWKRGGSHNELFLSGAKKELVAGKTYISMCKEVWEVDLIALEGYCNMLVYSGRAQMDDSCPYLETDAWLQALFVRKYEVYRHNGHGECLHYMATEAGHPKPEVFK